MAFTVLLVATEAGDSQSTALLISQEYLPFKELDDQGKPRRDRPWQHPEISSIYFSELGNLSGNRRPTGIIDHLLLQSGGDSNGGHIRVVKVASKPDWLEARTVSWSYQDTLENEFQAECEKERRLEYEREAAQEAAQRAPVYGFCERCQAQTEQCKSPNHRGARRCMSCSGGLSNSVNRFCTNCVDLPWREQRERAAGQTITYANEE